MRPLRQWRGNVKEILKHRQQVEVSSCMVKTLKRGNPAHCEATETVERKCKGNTETQATNRGEFLYGENFKERESGPL